MRIKTCQLLQSFHQRNFLDISASITLLIAILRSRDPFLGLFNFQISLAPNTGPVKKTASWTVCLIFNKAHISLANVFFSKYSKLLNKVYCIPGVSVPVEVSTNDIPPLGTVIRAMAIYAKAEHGQQAITRCENHKKNREFDKDGMKFVILSSLDV